MAGHLSESAKDRVAPAPTFARRRRDQWQVNVHIGFAYVVLFATIMVVVWSDWDTNTFLTCGSGVQFLGFYSLYIKVKQQKSVAGLSSKTLELYALVLCFRLVSTLVRGGYMPMGSARWIIQGGDLASLGTVFSLLCCIHSSNLAETYQEELDSMEVFRALPVCIVVALFIHGELDGSPIFDTLWAAAMNLDTVALIPQLWMLSKIGGEVDGLTAHFVASLVVSRACSLGFWCFHFGELRPEGKPNVPGGLVLCCLSVQLLAAADFMWLYCRARCSGRQFTLPQFEEPDQPTSEGRVSC